MTQPSVTLPSVFKLAVTQPTCVLGNVFADIPMVEGTILNTSTSAYAAFSNNVYAYGVVDFNTGVSNPLYAQFAYSVNDGKTFQAGNLPTFGTGDVPTGFMAGNPTPGITQFVALGATETVGAPFVVSVFLIYSNDGINWTRTPALSDPESLYSQPGNTLSAVAHNGLMPGEGGKWIAVGAVGDIVVSTDGINWAYLDHPYALHNQASHNIQSLGFDTIVYSNNTWVISGSVFYTNTGQTQFTAFFYYSTDNGVTWNVSVINPTSNLNTLCMASDGHGTWLALSTDSSWQSVDNGRTFNEFPTSNLSTVYTVTYFNNMFWCVAPPLSDSNTTNVYTSLDNGETWQLVHSFGKHSVTNLVFNGVTGNGQTILSDGGSDTGPTYIRRSNCNITTPIPCVLGAAFDAIEPPVGTILSDTTSSNALFSDEVFAALMIDFDTGPTVGGGLAYQFSYSTDDGVTWLIGNPPTLGSADSLVFNYNAIIGYNPILGANPGGMVTQFVAGGIENAQPFMVYSNDGISWTRAANIVDSSGFFGSNACQLCSVVHNGLPSGSGGKWMGNGSYGRLFQSTDGVNWSYVNYPYVWNNWANVNLTNLQLAQLAYGNGVWGMCATAATISPNLQGAAFYYSSDNGVTWQGSTFTFTRNNYPVSTVTNGSGMWIVLTNSNTYYISTDNAVTFTETALPINLLLGAVCIVHVNGAFWILGNDPNNSAFTRISRSVDGINWTGYYGFLNQQLYNITYNERSGSNATLIVSGLTTAAQFQGPSPTASVINRSHCSH